MATISTLAVQLLGAQLSESEKETINSKAESKAEKGTGLLAGQLRDIVLLKTHHVCLHKHWYSVYQGVYMYNNQIDGRAGPGMFPCF